MIYKFKSKASGDVIMLGPQGDQMLQLLGRGPAAQGIIEPDAMATAIGALQAAIDGDEPGSDSEAATESDDKKVNPVGLKARLWPMVDMLRRAQAAGEPVVWGV